ncbi:hypothetical protein PLESTB_001733900 [Pleodorina starrii]|uniref:Uncharacterized protein n=1 Tax=Pleodorina starrii TaxID=330485 RepID=A0A9W6BZZ3_9CHLO|nr:hypothetical protein PLESTB_001733900 [Pleodorina starrii]
MQTVTIGGRWTAYYQFHWPQVAWLNLAKDLYEALEKAATSSILEHPEISGMPSGSMAEPSQLPPWAVMYSDANPSASIYTVPTLPGSRTASIVASACRASGSTLLDNEAPGEDDTAVSSLPEKLGDGGGAGPADGGQLRDLTVAAAEQPRQGDDDAPRAGGLGDGGGAAPADVGQLRDLTAAAAEQPRQGDYDTPRAGGLGDGGGATPADGGQLRDLTAAAAEQPRQDDDDAPRAGGLGDGGGAAPADGGQLRYLTAAAAEQPRQDDDDAPRAGGLGDGGGAAPADGGQLRYLTAAAAEQPRQGDDDAPRAGGLGDGGGAAPADGGQLRDLTAAAAEQPRQDDDDAPRAGGLGDVPGATAIDGTEGSFVSEMEEGSTDAEVQSPAVEETEARLQGKEVTYASRHPVKRRKPSPSAMQAGSSAEQELDPDISVWVAGIVTDSSAGPSSQVGHKSVPAALYKCEGIKHARSYLEMAGVVTLEPPELKELLDKIPDAAEAAIQLCKLKGEPIFQELRHNNDGNYCYDKHDKGRLLMDYGTGGQRWMVNLQRPTMPAVRHTASV